jgi:hypothetical protein
MKIEIEESLFLSWLKHVKGCQIVQTNWKAANEWDRMHEHKLQDIMEKTNLFFKEKYFYQIYKGNTSIDQLISQAEIDVIGISFTEGNQELYAIDVAFHEGGLNYGSKDETVMRVMKKILRTAMCIYGYYGFTKGNIIFAAPKINPAILEKLIPCLIDAQKLLLYFGLEYKIRLFTNEEFGEKVLQPVVAATALTADTSELFMRSLQMYNMFSSTSKNLSNDTTQSINRPKIQKEFEAIKVKNIEGIGEMKIGALVRSILTNMLLKEEISKEEIELMQTEEYSKRVFDIQFPLLVKATLSNGKKPNRYWAGVVESYGERYFICSEWYEVEVNNDRHYFMKWLALNSKTESVVR